MPPAERPDTLTVRITLLFDLVAFAGLVLLLAGLAWAWPPLCLIVAGAGMLAGGIWLARKWTGLHQSPKQEAAEHDAR
jgi:hypothetical protein